MEFQTSCTFFPKKVFQETFRNFWIKCLPLNSNQRTYLGYSWGLSSSFQLFLELNQKISMGFCQILPHTFLHTILMKLPNRFIQKVLQVDFHKFSKIPLRFHIGIPQRIIFFPWIPQTIVSDSIPSCHFFPKILIFSKIQ